MNESRRQFEEWWNNPAHEDLRRSCAKGWGAYIWQASRQAIEITIPDKISKHNTNANGRVIPEAENYDEAIQDCAEAILAAGVKLKGGQ